MIKVSPDYSGALFTPKFKDMKKYIYLFFALIGMQVHSAKASAPTWSVNPASFQYNMTMVAVASINCTELSAAGNQIAAFVGNSCRGTAYTSQVVNGRFTASLFIYSNQVQGEVLTFKVYNQQQDSVYSLPVTLAFQQNASYGTSGSPYALVNNNAPVNLSLSASSFPESLSLNAVVGALSAEDPDAGETFTYSLVSGEGSLDNAKFAINGSNLVLNQLVNFEQKRSCSIRVRVSDSRSCTFEKNLVIQVTDVNEAPFALYLNDSSLNENLPANTVFASLSAADPDDNETFLYSLVSGTGDADNSSFIVVGNTLRSAQSFNYETKSSYSVRIRVRDSQNQSFERAVQIFIRDVNDAPSGITLNGSSTGTSFPENRGIGTLVATLSTQDEDAGSSFIYSFVNTGGNDNSSFQLVGNQIRANMAFDFETRQNYSIFIQSSDGNGGTVAKQFLVQVTDSNDAPVAIGLSGTSVFENLPIGSFVAKLNTSDPDENQLAFNYALVNGSGSAGNSQFLVRNDSLFTNAVFNFEVLSSYSIRLRSTDPGNASVQQSFVITVLDGSDAPTDIILSNSSVSENQSGGTTIGTLSSVDQDQTNFFTYSLVSGAGSTDNSQFSISGSTLRTNAVFDAELKSQYSIRVRTNDGYNGVFEKVFLINILDMNDAPTNISLTANAVKENVTSNTLIGFLSASDQDAGQQFTFSFDAVSGNNNSNFVISGNQLRTLSALDYENKSSYLVQVLVSDGHGGSFSKQFQINVLDSNDAPTDLTLSSPTISENQLPGAFIAQLIPVDQDASGTYSYSLVSGSGSTNNVSFFVRNDSLFTAVSLDFEQNPSYSIRLSCQDGLLSFSKSFQIRVVNGNDAPTDLLLSNLVVAENLPQGTTVGVFSSLDPDTGNVFTYSLVPGTGSTNNNAFLISGNQLKTASSFNYEAKNSYSIRVQTSDGNGGALAKVFTITILDANDVPTQINLSAASIMENKPANSLIGLLTTSDEDASNTFTYSLSGTMNDNVRFIISGNQLRTNQSFDFESRSNYVVQIQTNDGNGGLVERQFAIAVADTNDAPTAITLTNQSVEENLAPGAYIGQVLAIDPDMASGHSFALVAGAGSSGNASFTIRQDSLFAAATFDFEANPSYSIRVRGTDQGGLFVDQALVIQVLNRNDNPTGILLSNSSLTENLPTRSLVGILSATDPDQVSGFSYSLVAGSGATDNGFFSIQGTELRSNTKFNYENRNTYSIRVQVNDGVGGSMQQIFQISILDSNDIPTGLSLTNEAIAENRASGSLVGLVSVQDEDAGESFSFSFFNGASNNNDQFVLVNNQLRTAARFNYEQRDFYLVYVSAQDALGAVLTRQFVITVSDSSDTPTDLNLSSLTLSENLGLNAFVGTLTSSDEDQLSGFTYSFTGGTGALDNNLFEIRRDSLFAKQNLDFESRKNYSIRIRTTDNTSAFFDKAFGIQVTDANDKPSGIQLDNSLVKENNLPGALVGKLTASDQDENEQFTYAFVSGTGDADNASFTLAGNQLAIKTPSNFEQKSSYSIRIEVIDSKGEAFAQSLVIQITDEAEAPTLVQDSFTVSESAVTGTLVGTIRGQSQDAQAQLRFELLSGSDYFSLNSITGELSLLKALDYEKEPKMVVSVRVKDARDESLQALGYIVVQVEDVLELNAQLPALNFMSPNGDGLNDAFAISNVELYKEYELHIFNESGMEVYSVLNNYNNDWTGTFNGETLPNGVYYFVFKKGDSSFKGSISIVNSK